MPSLLVNIYEISDSSIYKKFPYPLNKRGKRFGQKARRCISQVLRKIKDKPPYKGRTPMQSAITICKGTFNKAGIDYKTAS